MKASYLRQRLKPWILPMAMACGLVAHNHIGHLSFLTPWLIFLMLFITFCRINPREFHITPLSGWLIATQIAGAILAYGIIRPFSEDVAQGVFICIFCPTATAAPVITGMLGGSVPRLVTYSLISNVTVALLAPVLFAWMGSADIDLAATTLSIAVHVGPLIITPLLLALIMRRLTPTLHRQIGQRQDITFYVWALSLFIVVGKSVSFIMDEPASKIPEIIVIAIGAGAACILQFIIGRRVGARYGDRVAGAQGLGQKNTVLAIWMALTYLNPISSVGPAAYVAWQNTINSMQIYLKQRKESATRKQ